MAVVEVELMEVEWRMLVAGVSGWDEPTVVSDDLALAVGFAGADDLRRHAERIGVAIASGEPLERIDWGRAWMLTELAFARDRFGSGEDWEAASGVAAGDAIDVLRELEVKVLSRSDLYQVRGPSSRAMVAWQGAVGVFMRRYVGGRRDLATCLTSSGGVLDEVDADLAALRETRDRLGALVDLPEAEQRAAVLAELDRIVPPRSDDPEKRRHIPFWA